MRTLMLIGALLASAPDQDPPCLKDLYRIGVPYRQCVAASARRLEPSGEAPNDIATAAFDKCQTEGATSKRAVQACVGLPVGDRTWNKVQAQLRDDLVNLVVSIRAGRHAGA